MKGVKVAIGVAFVLSAASLTGNGILYQRFNAERATREQLESRQVQLEERNSFLESEVSQIEQYRQELERFRAQLKDYINQRDALKKELDGAYGQVNSLKKQIQELDAERENLTNQLNVGEIRDSAIVREATKLPTLPQAPALPVVTLPPAKSKPEAGKAPPQPKEKPSEQQAALPSEPVADQRPLQILSVNRQFKFVVINVGLRGRLKVGDTLRVEQNGKLIGRIQVEKLYENFSACAILEEMAPAQIKEGDLVRAA